ncbi:MAG: hypothetical protein M3Q16_03105 [Pseudomonadota bacterium]|nr:hypothetical protein [Pseudomonadota bacterium]
MNRNPTSNRALATPVIDDRTSIPAECGMVPLPCRRVRAARGDYLRWGYLFLLSTLLSAGLSLPAGKPGCPRNKGGKQNPGTPCMGDRHLEWAWHQTKGDALAHL